MKPLLFLLILFTIPSLSFSQQWGASTFGQFTNEANDVEINTNQELYTTGYITGETAFNSSNVVPYALGNGDIYIAKYSSTGSLIWQKTFGGSYSDKAIDLAIGTDQNILVTGQFFGTVSFGSITLTSSANSKDIFIVKLDPAGNVLWARKEGGSLAENAYGITVDHQNNVILTGQFQGSATIANNNFTSAIDPNTNQSSFDFFISKYDSNGTPLWSLNGFAEYDDRGLAVAVDNQNNIFFTGQFSKTLIFASNTYSNLGYNIGFLCKLNPAGQLQFFNQMKAGMTNPYDLELNSDDDVVVTGDFLGNMNYYDATGTHAIQNSFDKHIFILKTTNNGNYQWNYTLGSENDISARSVSMDPHKDIFVTGYFKCDLSQIQDTAEVTFNSVGFKDVYLLKINNSGQYEYIKHFGGKMDDEGHGVAITQNDMPHICGSFTKDLNFAYNYSSITTANNNYSLHQFYTEAPHLYLLGDSTRNSFLINNVNADYPNLNYFIPPATDSTNGYIVPFLNTPNLINDTLHFCVKDSLRYQPMSYTHFGPSYNYLWNTGTTGNKLVITTTGDYSVLAKRDDACALDIDSIHAISESIPDLPLLTDNVGINVSNPGPNYNNYHFCYPDSVEITYSNLQSGANLSTSLGSSLVLNGTGPFTIQQEGWYEVLVTNQYCRKQGHFFFDLDYQTTNDSVSPDIVMLTSCPTGDSIKVCPQTQVQFSGIDLFVNPTATFNPDILSPVTNIQWTVNGSSLTNYTHVKTYFVPSTSGWYTMNLSFSTGYDNLCGLDTTNYTITKQFYIEVLPNPSWTGSINGDNLLCENGSVFLVINNPDTNFNWTGPGIIWNNNNDSIEVNAAGNYHYSGTLIHPVSGCQKYFDTFFHITLKEAPSISSLPADGIVCPYDSVLMSIPSTYVSYQWIGPEGDSLSSTNQCYGEDLGFYYCHVLDNEGCNLTTPPYELREYTTPSITIMPDEFLCQGETVTIQLAYTGTPIFNWNPVNSTQDHITVNAPGVYSVQITQCGFTITDSIEIIDGSFTASISVSDSTLCYQDTVVITGNPLNLNYEWSNGQVTNGYYPVSDPGTYSALVTNEFGCTVQTNTVSIGMVSESTPPNIPSQTVCAGSNVVLSSGSPYILGWYSSADTMLITTGNQFSLNNLLNDTSFIVAFQSSECPPAFGSVSVDLIDSLGNYEITGDSILCQQEDGLFSVNTTSETISWHHGATNLGNSNPISIPFSSLNSNHQLSVQISNQCYSTTIFDSVSILPITHIELANDSITLCYYDTELAELITPNIDSITWNLNLGTVLTDELLLNGANNYGLISVSGQDQFGCSTDIAQLVVITSNFNTSVDVNFSNYCLGDSGAIIVNTNADSILWTTPMGTSYSDTIGFVVDPIHAGIYSIEYWDAIGCHYEDSVIIPMYQYPNLSILPDSIFCLNDVYTFYFPNDTNTYSWATYGNNTSIPILFDQNLILTATSPQGCLSTDTLVVHTVNCDDLLPNIITPNGDGLNDYFFIDDATSQNQNSLIIYNRYGNTIYSASPYKNDFNGEETVSGVYFYLYYPNGLSEPSNFKQGFLHIIGK